MQALAFLEGTEPFDIVFMDPPYGQDLERKVLSFLSDSALITPDTLLIAEEKLDKDFSYVKELGYQIARVKEYKTNKHVFLRLASGGN